MTNTIEAARAILSGRKIVQESGQDLKELSVKGINDALLNQPNRGRLNPKFHGIIKDAVFRSTYNSRDTGVTYVYKITDSHGVKYDCHVYYDDHGNLAAKVD